MSSVVTLVAGYPLKLNIKYERVIYEWKANVYFGDPLRINIKYEIVISEWKSNVCLSTKSCISSTVFAECGYSVAPNLSKGNMEKTKLSLKEKAHKIGLEFGKVN
jgi:hypothetical protein